MKGPWVSGSWLEYWDGNAIALNRPVIYTQASLLFLRVGLCSHGFFFCRRCGRMVGVGFDRDDRDALIAWTRVHAITIKARARKVL